MKRKKQMFNLSFIECVFSEAFQTWLSYKEEIKDQYKTQKGIELAYKKLKKLSNEDPDKAMAIVEESIEHGWKGLFPLRDERYSFKPRNAGCGIFEAADRVLQENQQGNFFN